MGNAIWPFMALPTWYFSTIAYPFSGAGFTAIPASGVISLVVGLMVAGVKKERAIIWALPSIALSHLLVMTAGLMSGILERSGPVLLAFLAIQLPLVAAMVFRSRASRLAAGFIGWFCLSYAFMAAVITALHFADSSL